MSHAALDMLADPEMVISHRRHERLMSDAKHLALTGKSLEKSRHRSTNTSTDAGINLVEQQRAGPIHCGNGRLERKKKTGHLTTGRHLRQRCHRLAWIGGEQELHSIRTMVSGITGSEIHLEAHIGQTHGRQQLKQ